MLETFALNMNMIPIWSLEVISCLAAQNRLIIVVWFVNVCCWELEQASQVTEWIWNWVSLFKYV